MYSVHTTGIIDMVPDAPVISWSVLLDSMQGLTWKNLICALPLSIKKVSEKKKNLRDMTYREGTPLSVAL